MKTKEFGCLFTRDRVAAMQFLETCETRTKYLNFRYIGGRTLAHQTAIDNDVASLQVLISYGMDVWLYDEPYGYDPDDQYEQNKPIKLLPIAIAIIKEHHSIIRCILQTPTPRYMVHEIYTKIRGNFSILTNAIRKNNETTREIIEYVYDRASENDIKGCERRYIIRKLRNVSDTDTFLHIVKKYAFVKNRLHKPKYLNTFIFCKNPSYGVLKYILSRQQFRPELDEDLCWSSLFYNTTDGTNILKLLLANCVFSQRAIEGCIHRIVKTKDESNFLEILLSVHKSHYDLVRSTSSRYDRDVLVYDLFRHHNTRPTMQIVLLQNWQYVLDCLRANFKSRVDSFLSFFGNVTLFDLLHCQHQLYLAKQSIEEHKFFTWEILT